MNAKRFLTMLVLIVLTVVIVFPVVMTLFFSLYSPANITSIMEKKNRYDETFLEARIDIRMLSVEQYQALLAEDTDILNYYRNSIFYAAAIMTCQAFIIPSFSYALSRFLFPGRDLLSFIVMMLLFLPFQMTMVPMALVLRKIEIMDTAWAIILPSIVSPFYIFLLRQHMLRIPHELFEAAQIDGAGIFHCFFHIAVPISKSILISAIVLSFADCWNIVEQPLIFLPSRRDLHPLSVLINQISRYGNGTEFASAFLYILPAVILYGLCQQHILQGIQLSSMK